MSGAMETAVALLREVLGDIDRMEDAGPEAMLVNDLGADSLDFIELEIALEDRGIIVTPDELPDWLTVQGLADLIATKVGGAA